MNPQLHEPTARNVFSAAMIILAMRRRLKITSQMNFDELNEIIEKCKRTPLITDCMFVRRTQINELRRKHPVDLSFVTQPISYASHSQLDPLDLYIIRKCDDGVIAEFTRAGWTMRTHNDKRCSFSRDNVRVAFLDRKIDKSMHDNDPISLIVASIAHYIWSYGVKHSGSCNVGSAEGFALPGAKSLYVADSERYHKAVLAVVTKHDGKLNWRSGTSFDYQISDDLYEKAQLAAANAVMTTSVYRSFNTHHPIRQEIAELEVGGFKNKIYTCDFTGISFTDQKFTTDREKLKGKTPREIYGRHYDGWRMGNRELEVMLWLAWRCDPFHHFPRDVMKIIVAWTLHQDAIHCLEKIFNISLRSAVTLVNDDNAQMLRSSTV